MYVTWTWKRCWAQHTINFLSSAARGALRAQSVPYINACVYTMVDYLINVFCTFTMIV